MEREAVRVWAVDREGGPQYVLFRHDGSAKGKRDAARTVARMRREVARTCGKLRTWTIRAAVRP